MSSSTVDALIREIALRHGVAVGRDDPIMILPTALDVLLKEFETTHAAHMEKLAYSLGETVSKMSAEARSAIEAACNETLASVHEEMSSIANETLRRTVLEIRSEAQSGAETIKRAGEQVARSLEIPLQATRTASLISLAASALVMVAAFFLIAR
ncbi:MAG: hypothetical protein LBU76_06000 [Azoarcus sp.]|jgi:hypothetical protein|nr:hypothetical protein [Azoarcus sp.]